jgi:acyl CoA:acetate/3-ketoacid CoA transferase beta subunit
VLSDLAQEQAGSPRTPRQLAADQMVVSLGREIAGGIVGVGAFTPLAMAAAMWAKAGHAKRAALYPISFNGTRVDTWFPLSYSFVEGMTLAAGVTYPIAELTDIAQHRGMDFEAVMPLQMDRFGNVNLSVLGPFDRPTFRGPGANGIDALCVMEQKLVVYTPRHSPRTFVENVDFVTGAGNDPRRRQDGGEGGVRLVITDLCIMDFGPDGLALIRSLHPGVSVEQVQEQTGFELPAADGVAVTDPPSPEDLERLNRVDPLGIREMDFMSGRERREALPGLLERELDYFSARVG